MVRASSSRSDRADVPLGPRAGARAEQEARAAVRYRKAGSCTAQPAARRTQRITRTKPKASPAGRNLITGLPQEPAGDLVGLGGSLGGLGPPVKGHQCPCCVTRAFASPWW